MKLPQNCHYCKSNDIQQSSYYPNYWFCNNCKNGNEVKKDEKIQDPFSCVVKDKDGKIIDIIYWEV